MERKMDHDKKGQQQVHYYFLALWRGWLVIAETLKPSEEKR